MKLLVVVIYDADRLQDILTVLVELDVNRTVALNSEALMHVLAQEVPIFAGLRQLLSAPKSPCKTIFGVTERTDIIKHLDRKLRDIGINLTELETGYAFVLPIEGLLGSNE